MNKKLPENVRSKFDAIIDVRTKEEFEENHIEDAINIDIYSPRFEGAITDLDKTKSYLIYCTSGGRSLQATMFMRKNGFANVENLGGGISSLN
jgi:rhodanese-related sulfurtransferase